MIYPIQIDELMDRVSGNKEFVIKMLDHFFNSSDERLAAMRNEFNNQNYTELAELAHKLKGVLGNLSINKSLDPLKDLHTMAGQKNDAQIEILLAEIESTIFEAKIFYQDNPELNY
jgi:HPt (histidine-containing phosphotransfer) domain-containing protein